MKFKEYIKNINKFAEENPESLEMEVLYSKDNESNEFNKIYDAPILGNFDEDDKDFISNEQIIEPENEYDKDDYPLNAVCIN